jgi:hypothetical protein
MKSISASIIVLSGAICLCVAALVPLWESALELQRKSGSIPMDQLPNAMPSLIADFGSMRPHLWGTDRGLLAAAGLTLVLIGTIAWLWSFCRPASERE